MNHQTQHGMQHLAMHLAKKNDGPVGAIGGGGALVITAVAVGGAIGVTIAAPVLLGIAALGAVAGWSGAFKD